MGSGGVQGSIANLLAEWWGGDSLGPANCWAPAALSAASNLLFGGNPPYQLADFLAMYPKFGAQPQGVTDFTLSGTMAGYAIGDTVTPTQEDAQGAIITVNSVDAGGSILTATVAQPGTGYSVTTEPLPTTTSGAGTGALVSITGITEPNIVGIPPLVLQMYVNLASSCLQAARWQALWPLAMGWFVAHYATLYLRSEGSTGTTPGQVAASGLTRGIMVSKSAGGVSAGIQVPSGLDDGGHWTETEYGIQLLSNARIVGMGPMWVSGL